MLNAEVEKSPLAAATTPHDGPPPNDTGLAISGQEGSARPGTTPQDQRSLAVPPITSPSARSISAKIRCFETAETGACETNVAGALGHAPGPEFHLRAY